MLRVMIISPGRNFIFVHIPKTGGTSMAMALEARAHRGDILIGDTPKAVKRRNRLKGLTAGGRLWKHSTLADIDGIVTPDQIAQMLVFTIVRNPWDRAVSYYSWLQKQTFDHPAVALSQRLKFADFLRHATTVASLGHWQASQYVTDVQGKQHETLFLRLEHLTQDMAPLTAHLGFEPAISHENRSERQRDYRPYYSDELADHIQHMCQEDVTRFGYRFE